MKKVNWQLNTEEPKTIIIPVADSADSDDKIERVDNRIYFYSEVSRPRVLELNKEIRSLNLDIAHNSMVLNIEPASIYLHINSYGGSVFAGFAAVDYIKNSKVQVVSIIDGCAASAATMISVVANKRLMHENSFMLIHQLSSGMWGRYEELKDDMKNCDLLMEKIKKIYSEHTKIPKRKLNQILKRDLWFDAEACLKYGLVDEIINAREN